MPLLSILQLILHRSGGDKICKSNSFDLQAHIVNLCHLRQKHKLPDFLGYYEYNKETPHKDLCAKAAHATTSAPLVYFTRHIFLHISIDSSFSHRLIGFAFCPQSVYTSPSDALFSAEKNRFF